MGATGKTSNKVEDLKGRAKEATGRVTGNKDLEAEGKVEAAAKDVGQKVEEAGEKVKDVGTKAKHLVKP